MNYKLYVIPGGCDSKAVTSVQFPYTWVFPHSILVLFVNRLSRKD